MVVHFVWRPYRRTRLASTSPEQGRADLRIRFVGANPAAEIEGVDRRPGKQQLLHRQQSRAVANRHSNYGKVLYRESIRYRTWSSTEKSRHIEYDFVVVQVRIQTSSIRLRTVQDDSRALVTAILS